MMGIKVVILLLHSSNTFCQNKKGPFTHLPNVSKGVVEVVERQKSCDRNPQLQIQIEESYKLGSNLPLLRRVIILYLLSLPVHCVSLSPLSLCQTLPRSAGLSATDGQVEIVTVKWRHCCLLSSHPGGSGLAWPRPFLSSPLPIPFPAYCIFNQPGSSNIEPRDQRPWPVNQALPLLRVATSLQRPTQFLR